MKLIKLSSDHYIIVDDSKIKIDDYFYNGKAVAKMCNQWMITFTAMDAIKCKKITHSTEPIEHSYNSTSNGFNMRQMSSDVELVYDKIQQLSLSEVKKLIGEVDVEKKAEEKYLMEEMSPFTSERKRSFIEGYNQALEDNKDRKYTNEDMLTIRNNLVTILPVGDVTAWDMIQSIKIYTKWFDEYIESLQTPKSWDVEYVDGKLKLI